MRRALVCALVLAGIVATPAAAHAPPQVFLRQLDVSDQPTGRWIPLPGAHIASVNGYELGVRLETSAEHVLVEVTSQPATAFKQQNIYGLCFAQSGTPGAIKDLDEHIHYVGNGSYGVRVTVSDSPDASSACRTANPATSTGAFSVHGAISIRRVGHKHPVLDPLSSKRPFAGWRIDAPPLSHFPDVSCVRHARVGRDGSLRGTDRTDLAPEHDRRVPKGSYYVHAVGLPDPGTWSCQAQVENGSAYAKPRPAVSKPEFVRMRWYGLSHLALPDYRGPSFTLRGEAPDGAQGGRITLRLTRRVCGHRPGKTRVVHGRVSRKTRRVSLRFRLPRLKRSESAALYTATTTIGGARPMLGRRIDLGASLELVRRGRRQVLAGSLAGCDY